MENYKNRNCSGTYCLCVNFYCLIPGLKDVSAIKKFQVLLTDCQVAINSQGTFQRGKRHLVPFPSEIFVKNF